MEFSFSLQQWIDFFPITENVYESFVSINKASTENNTTRTLLINPFGQ